MENRLNDLETRLTFQEDSIETLSKIVTNQQAQIEALTRHLESMVILLKKMVNEGES